MIDGSQVGIIGGGPAGSFSALHLLALARQAGISLQVTIFEPRHLDLPGPAGCNRCAGILSSRLLKGLDQLGITLPDEVIQAELDSYSVHVADHAPEKPGDHRLVFQVACPDARRQIVSVYRGGGPLNQASSRVAGLDHFLLQQAVLGGASLRQEWVSRVTWEVDRPVIVTHQGRYPCDLAVLATGINHRSPLDLRFGYTAPETAVMAQDEFLRPPDWPANEVRTYFRQPQGLVFGAVIPKGQYVNVSLLGNDMRSGAVNEFLHAQNLEALQANGVHPSAAPGALCGCSPRIAVSAARRCFGERWVAVGDAAVTRLYKDGIGSAFYAAQAAMQTAVWLGVSQKAFRTGYAPYCRQVQIDNVYGRLLFFFWERVLSDERLLTAWERMVRAELAQPGKAPQHIRLLWGMFTGDEQYRKLFWMAFNLPALKKLFMHWLDAVRSEPSVIRR